MSGLKVEKKISHLVTPRLSVEWPKRHRGSRRTTHKFARRLSLAANKLKVMRRGVSSQVVCEAETVIPRSRAA